MPFLMLCSVLTTSASSPAADLVRVLVGVADDPPTLLVGDVHQATLVDEERRLLLGLGDDPFGLVLGLLDDPLTFGVDALGGADLLRDGDTQLVDQAEGGVLVDNDVSRQRELLAVGDERLEALDQEDDVDRSALQRQWRVDRRDVASSIARRPCGQRRLSASRSGPTAAAGIIPDTSPSNEAISLTRLELT
jgi:hypothetical protein